VHKHYTYALPQDFQISSLFLSCCKRKGRALEKLAISAAYPGYLYADTKGEIMIY